MDWEHSYLDYYPKDDSVFIDPMYAVYKHVNVPLDDHKCFMPVNTSVDTGNPNYIHPSNIRRDWNLDFAVLNPTDPAPAGWGKVFGNYRTKIEEEGTRNGTFYTDKDWRVKYQYFNGYTVDRMNSNNINKLYPDNSPTWKSASLNPQTGNWVLYKQTLPQQRLNKYGALPSRDSYLGL